MQIKNYYKQRLLTSLFVLAGILFQYSARAQEFLTQNFNNSAPGSNLPAGWTAVRNGAPNTDWVVQSPNPSKFPTLSFFGNNFAFCDADAGGSGSTTNSTLTSPEANTSSANLLLLEFFQVYRDYSATPSDSGIVEVFNGTAWVAVQKRTTSTANNGIDPEKAVYDISAFKNANMRIRFRYVGLWPWFWGVDNIRVYQPAPNDVGVTTIISPSGSCGLSAASQVKIRVFNFGSQTQTAVPASYRVGNGAPVSQTFTTSLAPNASAEFTFTQTVNLSNPGDYFISAWTSLSGDVIAGNDSTNNLKITKLGSTVSAVDFEQFDGNNLSTLYTGWNEAAGLSPTGNTSLWRLCATAQSDAFGTKTAAINLFTASRKEWIIMPSFTASPSSGLVFKAALTNWLTPDSDVMGSDDSLIVKISTNCGLTWTKLQHFVADGPLNRNLEEFVIPLSQYAGQEIKIAFYATDGSVDDVEDYDLHLDDIEIRSLLPNNLRMVAITSPLSGCASTAPVLKVRIKNIGTLPQSNFPICAVVNNLAPVCQNFSGTLTPNQEEEFTFADITSILTPGDYNIRAYTNLATDEDRIGDTVKNYLFQNLPVIGTFPYFESFENGNGGWLPQGTLSSWALGTPAKAVIQGASDGNNAYVTGGLGFGKYNPNEKSFLLSPCINFTGIQQPIIEMRIWWHSELGQDGAVLQGTINDGQSWFNIGQFNDQLNWYNSNNIVGLTGLATNRSGWTGGLTDNQGSGQWITVRNRLNGMGNIPNVKLRIAFGANASNQGDGLAVDAIRIYNQPATDVAVTTILNPQQSGCGAVQGSQVKIRVRNVGSATVSAIPVSVRVQGGATISGTIPGPIPAATDTSFTFATPVDLGGSGPFVLSAWTALPNDGFLGNDTLKNFLVTKKIGLTDTLKFTGFDGSNLNTIHPGWNEAFGELPNGNTSGWRQSTFLQGLKMGSATARLNMFGTVRNDWIVSPPFQLQAFPRLKFSLAATRLNDTIISPMGSDDKFIVKISEDCGATWITLRTITRDSNLVNRLVEKTVDLSAYEGKYIRLAFHSTSGPNADVENYDLHLDNVYIKSVSPADVGVAAILSPTLSCGLSNSTPVQVSIANLGTNAVSNFPVRFRVGNGAVVSQNFTGTIEPGQSATFSFTQGANLSAAQVHNLRVWTALEGDVLALNDSARVLLNKSVAPTAPLNLIPYLSSNLSQVNIGWTEAHGATAPTPGDTSWVGGTHLNQPSIKMFFGGDQKEAWILSPGTTLLSQSRLSMDVALVVPGTNAPGTFDIDDSLAVLASTDCGNTWNQVFVFKKNMDQAPNEQFQPYHIPLTAFANQEVRMALRARDGIRVDFTSDMFITNVRFTDISAQNLPLSQQATIRLFPNPAFDRLYVDGIESSGSLQVAVRDLSGKALMTQILNLENGRIGLSVGHLPAGAYFIQISGKDTYLGTRTLKFIKN